MMKNKYLLFLLSLLVIWLFAISYFYYALRLDESLLKKSQLTLAQKKHELEVEKFTTQKLRDEQLLNYDVFYIKVLDSSIPILIDKKTGYSYRFFIDLDGQKQGWQAVPFEPIKINKER